MSDKPRTDLSALENSQMPVMVDRYVLLRVLGDGGMSRVYYAELRSGHGFRKPVVVKVVRSFSDGHTVVSGALINEARVGGFLAHPNIVQTFDFGAAGGQFYTVMEYVDGVPLDAVVELGPLPPDVVLSVARQICRGLRFAHELQVEGRAVDLVHRDLKPSNIMLSRHGEVKILDFGLAKARSLTRHAPSRGLAHGTPSYMSPEQASGAEVDRRTDIFSLGVIIYEMATGKRLFRGKSQADVMKAVTRVDRITRKRDFKRAVDHIIPGLGDVLRVALASQPRSRYGTAREFRAALSRLQHHVRKGPRLPDWVAEILSRARAGNSSPRLKRRLESTSELEAAAKAASGSIHLPVLGQYGFDEDDDVTTDIGRMVPIDVSLPSIQVTTDSELGVVSVDPPMALEPASTETPDALKPVDIGQFGFDDDDDEKATEVGPKPDEEG